MSSERKALKIVCFLYVLDAIASLVTGGIVLSGMGLIDPADVVTVGGVDFALQPWALGFGVILIASGIFYLVFAMAGIKGANNPRKIGTFRVLAWVALIVGVLSTVVNVIFNGGDLVASIGSTTVVSIAFAVACIVLGNKVAEQAER